MNGAIVGEIMLDVVLDIDDRDIDVDGVRLAQRSWMGPGGAFTVARALTGYSTVSVTVVGVVGDDAVGESIRLLAARYPRVEALLEVRSTQSYLRSHTLEPDGERITGTDPLGLAVEPGAVGSVLDSISVLDFLIVADFAKQDRPLVNVREDRKIPTVLTTKSPERVHHYIGLDAVVVSSEDLRREGIRKRSDGQTLTSIDTNYLSPDRWIDTTTGRPRKPASLQEPSD